MPSSQDIATDAAAAFAAYPELAAKIDDGTTVPDSQLDRWIGASYANFVDGCFEQINEVFVGSRAISGPLRVAGAPAAGWSADADDIVIGDGSAQVGVSVYGAPLSTSGLEWRTAAVTSEAWIRYAYSANCLQFRAGSSASANAQICITEAGANSWFGPNLGTESIDIGRTAARWRDLSLSRHAYIDPDTAPATPASGAVLYVDTADGALKVKFSTGTVVTLGTP
jgi:hypothetical protein